MLPFFSCHFTSRVAVNLCGIQAFIHLVSIKEIEVLLCFLCYIQLHDAVILFNHKGVTACIEPKVKNSTLEAPSDIYTH